MATEPNSRANPDDYRKGRRDGMAEAAAWLDDAAGQHVRGSDAWGWLSGSAAFMRQRAEEIDNGR